MFNKRRLRCQAMNQAEFVSQVRRAFINYFLQSRRLCFTLQAASTSPCIIPNFRSRPEHRQRCHSEIGREVEGGATRRDIEYHYPICLNVKIFIYDRKKLCCCLKKNRFSLNIIGTLKHLRAKSDHQQTPAVIK